MGKKMTPSSGWTWWMKWVSTLLLIASGVLAASGHGIPYNFLAGAAGNIGWALVAIAWSDRSLIVMSAVMGTLSLMAYLAN